MTAPSLEISKGIALQKAVLSPQLRTVDLKLNTEDLALQNTEPAPVFTPAPSETKENYQEPEKRPLFLDTSLEANIISEDDDIAWTQTFDDVPIYATVTPKEEPEEVEASWLEKLLKYKWYLLGGLLLVVAVAVGFSLTKKK